MRLTTIRSWPAILVHVSSVCDLSTTQDTKLLLWHFPPMHGQLQICLLRRLPNKLASELNCRHAQSNSWLRLPNSFSTPEPTILLACGRNRELWEQPFQACAIDADAQ